MSALATRRAMDAAYSGVRFDSGATPEQLAQAEAELIANRKPKEPAMTDAELRLLCLTMRTDYSIYRPAEERIEEARKIEAFIREGEDWNIRIDCIRTSTIASIEDRVADARLIYAYVTGPVSRD